MIEAVSENNIDDVLPLIRGYMEFYKIENISDENNRRFFSQFGEASGAGCQFIYRDGELAVGFATVYFSYTTSITAKVAILNDLYVSPSHRNKGIGRELIEHCRAYAKAQGAARLQWVTATDNESAQVLYDSLETKKSTWHFYTYDA